MKRYSARYGETNYPFGTEADILGRYDTSAEAAFAILNKSIKDGKPYQNIWQTKWAYIYDHEKNREVWRA